MKRSFLFLLISSIAFASCKQSHFKSIQIGDQIWMSENYSPDRFRNGDEITLVKSKEEWITLCSEGKPASCFPEINGEAETSYGRLFNWFAINDPRGFAPSGWHVPADDEWKMLTDYLGGEVSAAFTLRTSGLSYGQEDATGFAGKAGGGCKSDGTFFGMGGNGYWWTSTESGKEYAWLRQLSYSPCTMNSLKFPKQWGLSVRCIKD